MAKRSLKASEVGLQQLNKALAQNNQSKIGLAEQLGIARSTISNLFAGKPIDSEIFSKICEALALDWREITDISEEQAESSIDVLVQEVREKIRPLIQERCGTMRVLDMSQPIGLNDIYTDVNILEKITGRRRLEVTELLQGFDPESENFDRFGLNRVNEKRVPGLEAVERYSKLMVLGKPGAGKTTFLKYLAIHCISGHFQANRVPIFITLKDFAETANQPDLEEFITRIFANCGVTDTQIAEILKQGRALIILDGLDEIRDKDNLRVLRHIRDFSEQHYTNNFIITCRIAAQEYRFERFTDVEIADVEIADFDNKQIQTFVNKWFQSKGLNLAERFMQQLNSNQPIRELATSPLLLTLLCLVFEDSGNFPPNRAELYQEGSDTLLKKWDSTRGIERDQVYRQLSVKRKKDLLSQVAWTTFERKDYFFKQKDIEQCIADYIRHLPDIQADSQELQIDSEVVLKSIEAQHGLLVERAKGIYSFSHLTFQEYFAARQIVTSCNPYKSDDQDLQILATHINDYRWREVFLLTVAMMPNADDLLLLIKGNIDNILSKENRFQLFLAWVKQKSCSMKVPFKMSAVRAFYFDLALAPAEISNPGLDFDPVLAYNIDSNFVFEGELELNHTELNIDFCLTATLTHAINGGIDPDFVDPSGSGVSIDLELQQSLQKLEKEIPDWQDSVRFEKWQEKEFKAWTEKFRGLIIKHRNIGQNWYFTNEEKVILRQYYNANLSLVESLYTDCYVSSEVRSHIEDTLLLPIAEIEKRQPYRVNEIAF